MTARIADREPLLEADGQRREGEPAAPPLPPPAARSLRSDESPSPVPGVGRVRFRCRDSLSAGRPPILRCFFRARTGWPRGPKSAILLCPTGNSALAQLNSGDLDFMIGKKLRAYEITEEICSGGMATVFRAYQPSMDRHVAIKVIRSTILHDLGPRERFQREARLIARLEHPHLLPVYDFDGEHDPPYIVMRYLEGGTLKQVQQQGSVPRAEFLYILRQLAGALDYAHRQGVVHRDLKPSNVMIDREGNAFLTDFGIARATGAGADLTGTGFMVGTPGYMAPEQARGDGVIDKAADIYSLGVMAFEVLTGSP